MKDLVFVFNEKELLDSVYYSFAHSKAFQSIKKKGKIALFILVLALGGVLFTLDKLIGCLFWGVGIVFCFFFSKYLIFYYKIYFKKFLKQEAYQKQVGQRVSIHFDDTFFQTHYEHSEHKYDYQSIDSINETKENFFVKINSVLYIVFPKSQLDDIQELKAYFQALCEKYMIKYTEELDWTWR